MDIENLQIWKLGVKLAKDVYLLTERFPKREIFGLTDQIRRAAVSVPSNIAEARLIKEGFRSFLNTSRGSLYELKTQLYIAREIAYLTEELLLTQTNRESIHKIVAMIKFLKAKSDGVKR